MPGLALGEVFGTAHADKPLAHGGVRYRRRVHEPKAVPGIEHGHIERHQIKNGLVKFLLLRHLLLGPLAGGHIDCQADNQRRTAQTLHRPVPQHGVAVVTVISGKGFPPLHFAASAHHFGKGGGALLRNGGRALAPRTGLGTGFAQHPGPQGGVGLNGRVQKKVAVLIVEHGHGGGHLLQHALVEYPLPAEPLLRQSPVGYISEIQCSITLAGHRCSRHEVVLAGHRQLAGAGGRLLLHGPGQGQQVRQHLGFGRAQGFYQRGGGRVSIKQLAAGGKAQNGVGTLLGHGGQQALALLAPVGPGHVAVADEATRSGLVQHQVVEHQPTVIAQHKGLAEHRFAGRVQRPGAGGEGLGVGKCLTNDQLAGREGRRTGYRLQAKHAPEVRAHVLNQAMGIDQHHAQPQVVHQRANLDMQGVEGLGRRLLRGSRAGPEPGQLGFGLLAPGPLGGQLLRPFGIGKGGGSGHGRSER